MSTIWVDHQALLESHKRVIVNELVNGRNRARELQSLLSNRVLHGGSSLMTSRKEEEDKLVMEIMTSFTESLSVLMSESSNKLCGGGDDDRLVKAELSSYVEGSHCGGDRSSGDSSESKKRPVSKDRRGCYKRKKNSESWSKVSSAIEDGQAWRKYGQKEILNAPYPRAYFRCTRKFDQGCQATKQVQQIQSSPKEYKTTYIGKHTCITISVPQHVSMDASNPSALDSHVRSESGSTTICNKIEYRGDHGDQPPSSLMIPYLPVKKEEMKEATPTSNATEKVDVTSDMWSGFDFGLPEVETSARSNSSMQFLDMHLVKSIGDFESEFDFDQVY